MNFHMWVCFWWECFWWTVMPIFFWHPFLESRSEGNLAVTSWTFCSHKFGSQENEAPEPLWQSLLVVDRSKTNSAGWKVTLAGHGRLEWKCGKCWDEPGMVWGSGVLCPLPRTASVAGLGAAAQWQRELLRCVTWCEMHNSAPPGNGLRHSFCGSNRGKAGTSWHQQLHVWRCEDGLQHSRGCAECPQNTQIDRILLMDQLLSVHGCFSL